MKPEIEEKLLDNSQVSLKIAISKIDVKSEYDSLVNEYCAKVAIKGFRRGKVPADILIRKFGDSIKGEVIQNLMEKSLKEAFEQTEFKPLPYSAPQLPEDFKVDLDPEKSFTFEVTYDTFPKIKLGTYKGLEIKGPVVQVGKADTERELAAIQEQNSIVIDKDGGLVEKDDTVTIDYVELDTEGQEVEGTKREGFTFSVGSGYSLYKIDDDIIGMSKDEEKVLKKDYPDNFENVDLAGRSVHLKLKVTALKEKKLPEIDDELAQDVSEKYETLDDLKEDIAKRLTETADAQVRAANIRSILEKIADASEVPLPRSMLARELELRWINFVIQLRSDAGAVERMLVQQGKTKDDLLKEWEPSVVKTVKNKLIEDRIGELEKIEISDEEQEAGLAREAERSGRDIEELKKIYEKDNLLPTLRYNLLREKIHDFICEATSIKKGEKVKFLDFIRGNH